MNEPPPGGGAAVKACATGSAGRDGNQLDDADDPSAAATATTASTEQAPVAAPQATLKLRNDRGHVELSEDGFCKVRLVWVG